jgi:rhomboid protease GluP
VTYALLAVTVVVYLLQMASKQLSGIDLVAMWGMKSNVAIESGQWWRLVTPMFLHGGIFHIGFNMYALYVLGPGLERFYGKWSYLLLYLVAGVAGNVFSFIFSTYNSLGASTAIFGLLAAQGVFLYQHRDMFGKSAQRSLLNVIFIAVINFVIGLSPGIDNWGHLGGFVGGALYAWFAGPKLEISGRPPDLWLRNVRSQWMSLLVALFDLLLFVGLAMVIGGAR